MDSPDCFSAGFAAGFILTSALWIFLIVKGIKWFRANSSHNPGGHDFRSTATPAGTSRADDGRRDELISYRSRNGRSNYRFRIHRMGPDRYRVYVVGQPGYGSRDTGNHATHRLHDRGGTYICFQGRVANRTAARNLAAMWADKTEDYILHGRRF